MKTLKLIMIATVVSVALMSYADNAKQHVEKVRIIKVFLKQALTEPGLVCAMHQQLTPDFLFVKDKTDLYSAQVRYKHMIVEIYGTRKAWIEFFRKEPVSIKFR